MKFYAITYDVPYSKKRKEKNERKNERKDDYILNIHNKPVKAVSLMDLICRKTSPFSEVQF